MKETLGLFATKSVLPHGWTPASAWLASVADALIGVACLSVAIALGLLAHKRRDLSARRLVWLLAAVLAASGVASLIGAFAPWQPAPWLSAAPKAVAAIAATLAAIVIWRTMPRAVRPAASPQSERANAELERAAAAHRASAAAMRESEARYRELAESLEGRIAGRSTESEAASLLLQWESEERERAEAQLAQANATLKETRAAQARQGTLLVQYHQMASLMQACRSESEVYATVARFAPSLFGARSGAVYVLNATRSIAGSGVVWGEIAAAEQHFAAPDCWAMRRNKIHPEDTAQAEIGCPHMRSDNARRHACAPLTANGELLGVLHLRERPLPMDSHERAFFAMTAERIALAVANLRLRENLARQSVRDPLTGLFNRRYLEEFLALEERRVLRSGRSIGIVMIDLDRFKDVNERHGRQTGDDVLRRIATTLQEHTRAGDIVCRYGGEEFLLALPGASLEITMLRADHLRTLLTTDAFLVGDAMVGPLTVSIGVAAFPESGTSIADALAASDRAVYAAKQKGRNRVECEQWKAVA